MKKYHAAALAVAVLAAVLAAPLSPAAAQWSSQWIDYDPDTYVEDPDCLHKPYPIVAMVEENPGQDKEVEYSDDGGLTWKDADGVDIAEIGPSVSIVWRPKPPDGWTAPPPAHPYIIGEFGSLVYWNQSEGDYAFERSLDRSKTVRGECDGPHAGEFRVRAYLRTNYGGDSGLYTTTGRGPAIFGRMVGWQTEYSFDGGLTWVSSTAISSADYRKHYDGQQAEYVKGETSANGRKTGMYRMRYAWDSIDPQVQLVAYDPGRCGFVVGTVANPPTCFRDVDSSSSVHAENIQAIYYQWITEGCGDGRFCPSRTVTRAQMAAFLHRAVYGPEEVSEPPVLSDVASDAWYRTFALWAVKHDVIRAPGGRFDPGGAVSRADMAEMLVAVFNISVPDRAQGLFDDTTGLSDAAVRAIEGIRAAGVTAGCATEPLRYCPDRTVTRAQMASFLIRARDTGTRTFGP